MPDEALIAIVEKISEEYTPDALAFAYEEIERRGGMDVLKERVGQAGPSRSAEQVANRDVPQLAEASNDLLDRIKKFYWVFVTAGYGVFEWIVGGSWWFYWLCLFVMIGFWIRVWIRARTLTPDEEYAEIAREEAKRSQR